MKKTLMVALVGMFMLAVFATAATTAKASWTFDSSSFSSIGLAPETAGGTVTFDWKNSLGNTGLHAALSNGNSIDIGMGCETKELATGVSVTEFQWNPWREPSSTTAGMLVNNLTYQPSLKGELGHVSSYEYLLFFGDGITADDISTALASWDGSTLCNASTLYGPVVGVASGDGSPVPIPGALWLLGSGLLGFFGIRRRRQC